MERLTHKAKYEAGYRANKNVHDWECIDKLGQLEDLEEQGKLLKPPCAVGDTVYVKTKYDGIVEAEVRDYTYFISCGFCIVVTSKSFGKTNIPFSEFGKTVFLTQEATEAASKEMSE